MTKEEACGLLADDTVAIGRLQRPEALGCLKVNGRIKQRRTLVWLAYSFHLFTFFNWKIIALQSYVCFYCATPIRHIYIHIPPPSWGFPSGANAGDTRDTCSTPGLGRSWWRAWQPTPVLLPGESHGQRSLAGYSP